MPCKGHHLHTAFEGFESWVSRYCCRLWNCHSRLLSKQSHCQTCSSSCSRMCQDRTQHVDCWCQILAPNQSPALPKLPLSILKLCGPIDFQKSQRTHQKFERGLICSSIHQLSSDLPHFDLKHSLFLPLGRQYSLWGVQGCLTLVPLIRSYWACSESIQSTSSRPGLALNRHRKVRVPHCWPMCP